MAAGKQCGGRGNRKPVWGDGGSRVGQEAAGEQCGVLVQQGSSVVGMMEYCSAG